MSTVTQHGYLVIADISGYTSFVASTELMHSQEILSELLELILNSFSRRMAIHKLEGDAVFAYLAGSKLERGEALLELIESTYAAFRNKRDAAQRRTTCTCNACRNIPSLDLKFIAHYGEYVVQEIMDRKELVGSDVNLAHRLLKNHVAESIGWKAYALFSERCLERLGIGPSGLHESIESYEHLGEVRTFSLDLHARYRELMDARHVVISAAQAHYTFECVYQAPPEVVWEWFNDPLKRAQWMASEIIPILRVRGRADAGARNHCVHGKNQFIVEDILDMRPFEYFTVSHTPPGRSTSLWQMYSFQPVEPNETHFCLRFQAHIPYAPEWLKKQFCLYVLRTQLLPLWRLESINELIAEASPGD